VIFLVVGAASFAVVSSRIDWERSAEDILAKRAQKSDRAAPVGTAERMAPVMRVWSLASAPVVLAGQLFLVALALWAAERAFGGEARYGGVLALWAHANLANVVGAVLVVAVALTTPPASVPLSGVERLVKSSVGAFLPDSAPAPLVTLGSCVDLFSFAALALLVVGFRRITGLSRGTATALPIVLWLVYVTGKTGLAFLRG
jgi:hypothetical protein